MDGYDPVSELLELVQRITVQLESIQDELDILKTRVVVLESRGPGISKGW